MKRVELVQYIDSLLPENDSNIKFLTLLRSRLMEEGIPVDYSTLIAGVTDFDFSNVPEDDDTLSDIATAYASYCKRFYDKLKANGVHNVKEFNTFSRYFSQVPLQVEH